MFNQNFNPADFAKLFDPQAFTKNVQQFWDFNKAAKGSTQNLETLKKISGILADTYSTCTEKQMKMAQNAMEECVENVRELSTAKGMEEFMSRQAEWTRKCAETAQSNAQELAEVVQKGQSQCSDIISKMVLANVEWSKNFTAPAASNNVQK
ncbi:MAG TPA: phasin family protein [Alphaproteobacteria bacterium]|nr:phasin family protein [Alphaproteobacteria bacterium]